MKLDFSKFKKLSSTKNHTVLKHPDGHTIKIAHGALSDRMRRQLESIPATEEEMPAAKAEETQNYDDGGEVEKEDDSVPVLPQPSAPPPGSDPVPVLSSPSEPPEGSPKESDEDAPDQPPTTKDFVPVLSTPSSPSSDASDIKDTGPAFDASSLSQKLKQSMPSSSQMPPNSDKEDEDGSSAPPDLAHAYKMGQQAILQQANAEGQLGRQEANVQNKLKNDLSEANNTVQGHLNATNKEINDFKQDLMDNHIDPKRYTGDMSTPAKISTGIGLLLSGFGSALTHTDDTVARFLNDQIDRDINAQKVDMGKKENLMNINMRQFGNELQAAQMTKIQMLAMAQADLAKQAALAQNPLAQARAKQALASMESEMAKYQQQFALGQALHGVTDPSAPPTSEGAFVHNLNTASQVNPEAYKEASSRYLPGIGVAKVPVAKEDREAFTALNELQQNLNEAKNFANNVGFTMYGTKADQQAKDIQNKIQLSIGQLVNLKRINEFEAKKYTEMAGNPGAFRTQAAVKTFDDLNDFANQRRQSLIDNLGVTRFSDAQGIQGGQAPQSTAAAAPQPMIRTVNGVQYQKVQGGWKKVS